MMRLVLTLPILIAAALGAASAEVVVYVSLDEMYSRPILDSFEENTGITVRAVYDTEAAKTTGLATRLIAERALPRADVFWNNEVAQTIVLKKKGALLPYASPAAEGIPPTFKDPDHYWTGFAARGRVIIYNTKLVDSPPTSVHDLLKPEWRGRAGIANPLFGTTASHVAAWFAHWGAEEAKTFLQGLRANDVQILAGNATVRDRVAAGDLAIGLTDTDDANGAVVDGKPARWIFPDQEADGLGTLVLPNTVALIHGAPNEENGKRLIDYLLSPEVERRLAGMRSIQIPVNPVAEAPEGVPRLDAIRTMPVSFDEIADEMADSAAYVRGDFQP